MMLVDARAHALLSAALAYVERGLRVIPLHNPVTIVDNATGQRLTACSCRKGLGCEQTGKHPRIKKGTYEQDGRGRPAGDWGTRDPARVRAWWGRWPHANIAIATGSGVVVADIDSRDQAHTFLQVLQRCGVVDAHGRGGTLSAKTSRGMHAYFRGHLNGTATVDGILVRGEGSYVVAPPSLHASGVVYSWLGGSLQPWNTSLQTWYETGPRGQAKTPRYGQDGRGRPFVDPLANLGPLPEHLKNAGGVAGPAGNGLIANGRDLVAQGRLENPWSPQEQLRLERILSFLDPDMPESEWIQVLMVYRDLQWVGDAGGAVDIGRELAHAWSARGRKYRGEDNFDAHWRSCGKNPGPRVQIGTLVKWAKKNGWKGDLGPLDDGRDRPGPRLVVDNTVRNGPVTNDSAAAIGGQVREQCSDGGLNPQGIPWSAMGTAMNLGNGGPAAAATGTDGGNNVVNFPRAIGFPDTLANGKPRPTCNNAVVALHGMNVKASYNAFSSRLLIEGHGISAWRDHFDDEKHVPVLRNLMTAAYGLDCGDKNTFDAFVRTAHERAFNPVRELIDHCEAQWDGVPRADTWLIDYMGAADTPLNRAIGRIALVALVARALDPGCKFDTMIVFTSFRQGTGKSSAIRALVGAEYFRDDRILDQNAQKQMELLEGVWGYEISELEGMRQAEHHKLKGFMSRQVDNGRAAYGRKVRHQPRTCVLFGTTNEDEFLMDPTGQRRYLVVKLTGKPIDVEGIARMREQLIGEAAVLYGKGAPIVLDESLWPAAAEQAEQHFERDAWESMVAQAVAELETKRGQPGHEVTVGMIARSSPFQMTAKDITRGVQMRIAAILQRMRYVRVQTNIGGTRTWHYVRRPDTD